MKVLSFTVLGLLASSGASAFLVGQVHHSQHHSTPSFSLSSEKRSVEPDTTSSSSSSSSSRREVIRSVVPIMTAVVLGAGTTQVANAGIDPNMLKNLPVEGDASGATMRLQQIQADKIRPTDTVEIPYTELDDGVKYRDYREGRGDVQIQPGSKVAVEMTIRCQSFATNTEPGGVKYYSTKDDTEFNEFAFTVGGGEFSPAVEEGMMGMKKGGLRRIIVPSIQVFSAKKANQLPLPTTKDGKRRFESLFKTDATLLFEVLVTRIK